MPAWRIDDQDRAVNQYDVGASDGLESQFVGHVLLCDSDPPAIVNLSNPVVSALHMGPPLQQSPHKIDVLASAELESIEASRGERRQIKTFVDERFLEQKAQAARLNRQVNRIDPKTEYIIHPCAVPPDQDRPHWRFNCAGFVMYAYLEANIQLVDETQLPELSLDDLKQAYPGFGKKLDDPNIRNQMGIGTGERWPVVLAGYVVNSMSRPADQIRLAPYSPKNGDAYFPSRLS